jgi:hypothetical protein
MEIQTGNFCVSEDSRRSVIAPVVSVRDTISCLDSNNVFNLQFSELFKM